MMDINFETINSMISNEQYNEILKLDSPLYDSYKCIAAIFLEEYTMALNFIKPLSYEQAYIYYKLRKFRKSLKIIKRIEKSNCCSKKGEQIVLLSILKSQCLWNLGDYEGAIDVFNLLKEMNYEFTDEEYVNIAAIKGFFDAENKDLLRDSKILSKEVLFKDANIKMEYEYNNLFKFINNEKKFIEELEKLDKKYDLQNTIIKKQLFNLSSTFPTTLNKEENDLTFTKKQKEILDFNSGKIVNYKDFYLYPKQKEMVFKNLYLNGKLKKHLDFDANCTNSNFSDMKTFSSKEPLILLKTLYNIENLGMKEAVISIKNTLKKCSNLLSTDNKLLLEAFVKKNSQ